MATPVTIEPLSDRALILRFGDRIDPAVSRRVLDAWRAIDAQRPTGVVDLVPAYTTLAVHYDWRALPLSGQERPWQWLTERLRDLVTGPGGATGAGVRTVVVPVCYEAAFAPDLADIAQHAGLSIDEVVRRHSGADYVVACVGFRPGFPYLLGLDPALAMPRLDSPRARVRAGSVGLAGQQTGIYPNDSAGGWRLLGATPLRLFDPRRESASLLAPGDRVRFQAIDGDTFARLAATGGDALETAEAVPAQDAALAVLMPGIHSTLQDTGRPGSRHLGIGNGGASDPQAAALANRLVGNDEGCPVLEMTLRGPDLQVLKPAVLALTGAGMTALADDRPLRFGQPVTLPAGTHLRFRPTGHGARAWLAIGGGFRAPTWLGSAAVDTGNGLHGRPLQTGDRLASGASSVFGDQTTASAHWWVEASADIDPDTIVLRFVADRTATTDTLAAVERSTWRVGQAANRTGYRLQGASPVPVPDGGNRISEAVLHGTLQVPPDGQPIVLGPDCQTIGGYPVAGHVIQADLPLLAQLKPGDELQLRAVTVEEAHAARQRQATGMARQRIAIEQRLRHG